MMTETSFSMARQVRRMQFENSWTKSRKSPGKSRALESTFNCFSDESCLQGQHYKNGRSRSEAVQPRRTIGAAGHGGLGVSRRSDAFETETVVGTLKSQGCRRFHGRHPALSCHHNHHRKSGIVEDSKRIKRNMLEKILTTSNKYLASNTREYCTRKVTQSLIAHLA